MGCRSTAAFARVEDRDRKIWGLTADLYCGRDTQHAAEQLMVLQPGLVQRMEAEVSLDLTTASQALTFGPQDLVALTLDVKNVAELVVNMFEVDSAQDVNGATLDLDGLLPNHTKSFS